MACKVLKKSRYDTTVHIFMNTITRVDSGARMHAAHRAGGFIPPGECLVISRHGKVVSEANSGGTRAAGESMLGCLDLYLTCMKKLIIAPCLLTYEPAFSPATNCPPFVLVANQPARPRDVRLFRPSSSRRLREISTEDLSFRSLTRTYLPSDFYYNKKERNKELYGIRMDKTNFDDF